MNIVVVEVSVRWTWIRVCAVLVFSIRACNLVSIYRINQLWHVCERVLSTIFNRKQKNLYNFLRIFFNANIDSCSRMRVCIHSTIKHFSIRFIHNLFFFARATMLCVQPTHTHTYELECNRDSMHLMCTRVTEHKSAFVHVCRSFILFYQQLKRLFECALSLLRLLLLPCKYFNFIKLNKRVDNLIVSFQASYLHYIRFASENSM